MKRNISILVVDDDEDEFFIFQDYLEDSEDNYTVDWAPNYDSALPQILDRSHDLYVVDFYLGIKNGIDLLKEVRRNEIYLPIILLTGQGDKKIDNESLEQGASDYLNKSDLSPDLLERSIRYAMERYRNQKELRMEKYKYSALFEQSIDPIVICNLDFEVYECNKAFQEYFGKSITAADRLVFENFIENDLEIEGLRNELKLKGKIKDYETNISSITGAKNCLVSGVTMTNIAGIPIGYQVLFHDMTSVREAEREMRDIEKMAYTNRMIRTLAHEVRNPLTNINLAVDQVWKTQDLNPEDRELFFDMIKRNSNRINDLISQLLDSSMPTKIEKSEIALNDILDESIEFSEDRIFLNEVKITKQLSEDVSIKVDRDKILIALLNIISNAFDAMEDNEYPQLNLSVYKENERAIIEIEDNGKGMSEKDKELVFEPFYTNRPGGKGMGMALTKTIIDSHKGKIKIQSEIGKGTKFILSFPLADD